MHKIVLAGGCFWGVEAYFKQLKGVVETSCGYANGNMPNPTYRQVCDGIATHAEVIDLTFDETVTSLETILEHYFRIVDPTTLNRQGPDRGIQYRSGIYVYDDSDLKIIKTYIEKEQKKYEQPIVVEVKPLENYDIAEAYHQDYLDKNPNGYCHIDLNLAKDSEKK